MRAVYLAAALLVSGFAVSSFVSSASAAPVAPINGASQQSSIIDVQYRDRDRDGRPDGRPDGRRDDRRYDRRHMGPPPRYRAGGRYDAPPRGWRRYDRRPGDWNRRGCVMVGPVWFCQ